MGFMIFTPDPGAHRREGDPRTSTMVLMMHISEEGHQQQRYRLRSAMSLLLMSIILVVSVIQSLPTRERKPKKRSSERRGIPTKEKNLSGEKEAWRRL